MSFLAKADKAIGILKRQLGETVIYRHQDGGSVSINAVWDRSYEIVDADSETVVSSTNPHIGVELTDLLEAPKENDKVEFLNDVYRVVDIEPDGQGAAQIVLFKL